MTVWKHRDSELDRTCGVPIATANEPDGPICADCDGEVYRAGFSTTDSVASDSVASDSVARFSTEGDS